eukprot:TRINITY_DN5075_c0_g2_i1.p2 TRINITY_DN5075_c0_g2~~TRINITY_DN5075_c0_g2_i1.p2  ORF type:complete len:143 (+),score=28.28 TRINITY_DN5075_c0_g2_i1:80-508(+)
MCIRDRYKSSRLSSVANEPKDFSDKSITKRSVINFPKIIVTENLGDYSIDKAHSKAVNPFSAQVDPVQEELKLLAGDINFQNVSKNLVGENEVVKKKITPSQEVFLPKVNEELKITNTRNDGFGMEGGSGTSSYQVELIVEV